MRNLYIHPENFYLINTKTVLESTQIYSKDKWSPSPSIYVTVMSRRNVGVIKKQNHFFELEKMKGKGLILPRPISDSFQEKESTDKNSIRKFSYPKDFNDKNVTLESVRSVYRKYLFENENTIQQTESIEKFYVGNILKCNYQSLSYLNTERYLNNALLLKFSKDRYMTLDDFLSGQNLYYYLEKQEGKYFVDSASLQEQSLEEIKDLYYMKKRK